MAIKSNRYFNDPQIAQVAQNIAGLFDAPSGSDLSGYATARQTNEESNRLAQLFTMAQSPDFNQQEFDRMAIANKNYAPVSSFYAVDADTAAKRYGYDQSLAGTKYTADEQARVSAANNAADNTRALATNKSDNLAKLITEGYGNVGTGEVQREIPLSVMSQFGGTEAVPEFKGPVKPLTVDEVKGAILGQMDQPQQEQAVLGTDTVPIVNADGSVSYMSRAEANITGQTPVLSSEQEKGRAFASLPEETRKASVVDIKGQDTYHSVDAQGNDKSFVGYIGSDNRIYDQAHPEKPAEGVVSKGSGGNQFAIDFNPDGTVAGIRQGAGVAGSKPTEANVRSGYAAEVAQPSVDRLMAAYDDPTKMPSAADMTIWPTLAQMGRSEDFSTATAGRLLNDKMVSGPGKEFFLDLMNMLPLELMQRSGLAQTQTEWANELYSVVPQPNDTPQMRLIRKEHLQSFLKATKRAAGPSNPDAATGAATGAQQPAPAATAAPAAQAAPGATAEPAAAPAAGEAPDRAASIANAKEAILAKKPREAIIAKLKAAFPDFDPKELDQ